MSKQDGIQVSTVQPPTTGDMNAWRDYWQKRGQLWRTEPEIDVERQKYLAERRSITPDIEQGIYSFKGIKLTRADIEWLLATHENGRGSISRGGVLWPISLSLHCLPQRTFSLVIQ